ncbi:hypothetical protein DPMN_145025 [Dreissena polymorpha]|uniref:IRG-type G domain-containing protein n=1 Tax=Dreissena polymorpha TaxID=45954 RepID=A0A9D4F931_DREPO|nr:hypothetical protein DPMN_145025 [Dreissena polymorpha]
MQFMVGFQTLYGFPKFMKKLLDRHKIWKNSHDEGATKAGCNKTSTAPACYPHPNNSNLVYWDLPGVGTKQFPKHSYLEKVHFNMYDAIILVSATRFTELDDCLAIE